MKRKIIEIDQELCNGCGLCVQACHEGAIELAGGKARVVSDQYCDGLGNCLPQCPVGAIAMVEKETAAFDEAAVIAHLAQRAPPLHAGVTAGQGCPGSAARVLERQSDPIRCAWDRSSGPCGRDGRRTLLPLDSGRSRFAWSTPGLPIFRTRTCWWRPTARPMRTPLFTGILSAGG